jgi:hypothetical protein
MPLALIEIGCRAACPILEASAHARRYKELKGKDFNLATNRPRAVTTSLWVICVDFGRTPAFPEFRFRALILVRAPHMGMYGTMESIDHTATTDVQG